jgi:Flp pilus assembly protein TadG
MLYESLKAELGTFGLCSPEAVLFILRIDTQGVGTMKMKRRVRGQSLVEMAMVFPILIMFTIGTIELSWYIYNYSELENATRRASEAAAKTPPVTPVTCDDSDSPTCGSKADRCAVLAKNEAISGSILTGLKTQHMTISYVGAQHRAVGNQIQVETTYTGTWITPIGRQFFGESLKFNFVSRRTISSLTAPEGLNALCEKP